ncbi:hypothetical protein [Erysipelothrix anatis]|uniref:hypothetical protein n=1 Tax=Erysipelothrix anatis TaxID=2683713 RepID=UPI00135B17F5|nr:hypothetical protein [Erysipelothrix anatis]
MNASVSMLNVLLNREIASLNKEIQRSSGQEGLNMYAADAIINEHVSDLKSMLVRHGIDAQYIQLITLTYDLETSKKVDQQLDYMLREVCQQSFHLKTANRYAAMLLDYANILRHMQKQEIDTSAVGLIPAEAYQRYADVNHLLIHSPYHTTMRAVTINNIMRYFDETVFHFFDDMLRDLTTEDATFVLAIQYMLRLNNLKIYLKRPYLDTPIEKYIRRYDA